MARCLIGALWDHGADSMATKPRPNPIEAVPLVSCNTLRSRAGTPLGLRNIDRLHQGLELRRLVRLPRRRFDGKREPSAASNHVEFRAESAS